ncbi:MAG: hypothetical protein ABW352_17865 [Polyangiales bacterium]
MNAKLCALALLAGCTGGVGNDMTVDPNTGDEAGVSPPRDASVVDARRPSDGAIRDARVIEDARVIDEEDARVVEEEDADTPEPPPPPDAAVVDSAVPPVDAGNPPMPGSKPVFVAVGYRASRLISRDLGLTWTETGELKGDGDDNNLLRGAAYGNGLFVAVGWNLFTSPDGATWTARDKKVSEWIGGLDYGSGLFVGAGGSGTSIFSSDGISWSAGKPRDGTHTRSLAFGGGKFVGATDKVDWWSTTDGNTWTKDSGGHGSNQVTWCKDRFTDRSACSEPTAHGKSTAFGNGVYVSIDSGGNKLQRSTDGKTWTDVKTVTDRAWLEDVVFGLVP